MNLFRIYFIQLLFIGVAINSSGQVDLFIEITGNYSLLPLLTESGTNDSYINTESYQSRPGYNLSVGFEKTLIEKITIQSGIGLQIKNFQVSRVTEIPSWNYDEFSPEYIDTDDGILILNPFYNYSYDDTELGETQIYYLNIPINAYYSFLNDKVKIGLGLSASFIIHSEQYYIVTEHIEPEELNIYQDLFLKKITSNAGLTNILFNGSVSLEYRIIKSLSILADYSHSFTPIYEEAYRFVGDAKYRTINLGIKVHLSELIRKKIR